jgi:type IV fimbrial biogenesis protein FimT
VARPPVANSRFGRERGFTVPEILITLVISAVLLTISAPYMGDYVRNARLDAAASGLLRTMHYARSEAVKRNTRVVLCRSANPTASTPSCGGDHYVWTTGWLMFAAGDTDSNYQPATDTLIKIGNPATGSVTVRTNGTSNRNLEYNSDGTTNEGGGTARFAVCDSRGGGNGKQINVPPVGRPSAVSGSSGSPINCLTPS